MAKTPQQYLTAAKERYWANPEFYRAKAKKYHAEHPGRTKKFNRLWNLKRYGLDAEAFAQMLTAQGGICQICGKTDAGRRLCIDHCHTTGKVRALLCRRCNTGIGQFLDDADYMLRASLYLQKHKGLSCASNF